MKAPARIPAMKMDCPMGFSLWELHTRSHWNRRHDSLGDELW
jgi:hypothetical protein